MVTDMTTDTSTQAIEPTLPSRARLPINRCNLPTAILGGLTFQTHPSALEIDGIATFHRDLFEQLTKLEGANERAQKFQDYMSVHFRLHEIEDAGGVQGQGRANANYLRLLRGWFFDADGREAAVMKSWVESRFGLLTLHHKDIIQNEHDPQHDLLLKEGAIGLHNTNALEAQLDLLYAYCQFEIARCFPNSTHITLYRGINQLGTFDVLEKRDKHHQVMLFNNLNSFSSDRDTAEQFGDYILTVQVPLSKILFYSNLLPHQMQGEHEYIVLGGLYAVETATY
jgi:NAD+--dinitrogen-reductase ADP-D-ribosyltransferase